MTMHQKVEVAIIGAGIAGLSLAKTLIQNGKKVVIFEKEATVGGRTRTERIDGFLLDSGFQIFLPAYPESKKIFNYEDLNLHHLPSKALIRYQDSFLKVGDPMRHPELLTGLFKLPVLSFKDFPAALKLRAALAITPNQITTRGLTTTQDYLNQLGFSERLLQTVVQPFLRGVFLDPDLQTPESQARFVLKMFAEGGTALPKQGIQALANNLAVSIPAECILTNCEVTNLTEKYLTINNDQTYQFDSAVITDAQTSALLIKDHSPLEFRKTQTIYFKAVHQKLPNCLVLNPTAGQDEIHHLLVPSMTVPEYAPSGQHLISASVLTPTNNNEAINKCQWQLEKWFGKFSTLEHLKTITINAALPKLTPSSPKISIKTPLAGVYRCGDFVQDNSLNGALLSARLVGQQILGRHT